jgi:hypothetical protein
MEKPKFAPRTRNCLTGTEVAVCNPPCYGIAQGIVRNDSLTFQVFVWAFANSKDFAEFTVLPGFGPTRYEISGVGRGIQYLYIGNPAPNISILNLACEEDTGREPAPEPVGVPDWVRTLERLVDFFVIE